MDLQFISYDDVESMGYKTSFIKLMGLGGAMMWELSQDPNKVLLSKIYNDLGNKCLATPYTEGHGRQVSCPTKYLQL